MRMFDRIVPLQAVKMSEKASGLIDTSTVQSRVQRENKDLVRELDEYSNSSVAVPRPEVNCITEYRTLCLKQIQRSVLDAFKFRLSSANNRSGLQVRGTWRLNAASSSMPFRSEVE